MCNAETSQPYLRTYVEAYHLLLSASWSSIKSFISCVALQCATANSHMRQSSASELCRNAASTRL